MPNQNWYRSLMRIRARASALTQRTWEIWESHHDPDSIAFSSLAATRSQGPPLWYNHSSWPVFLALCAHILKFSSWPKVDLHPQSRFTLFRFTRVWNIEHRASLVIENEPYNRRGNTFSPSGQRHMATQTVLANCLIYMSWAQGGWALWWWVVGQGWCYHFCSRDTPATRRT